MLASDLRDHGPGHKRLFNDPGLEALAELPTPGSTDQFQTSLSPRARVRIVRRKHKPIAHSETVRIGDHKPQKRAGPKQRLPRNR
jgi:hypothetical protein